MRRCSSTWIVEVCCAQGLPRLAALSVHRFGVAHQTSLLEYGKSLLRRRAELVECSFAHYYDTGGMRRCHLRGHENIRKRQLIHVGAFNLSLICANGWGRARRGRGEVCVLRRYRAVCITKTSGRPCNFMCSPTKNRGWKLRTSSWLCCSETRRPCSRRRSSEVSWAEPWAEESGRRRPSPLE